jgi:hypothetical protein
MVGSESNVFYGGRLSGVGINAILRLFINKIGLGHMLSVRLQKHITGAAVDVLLVAFFMSVSFHSLLFFRALQSGRWGV